MRAATQVMFFGFLAATIAIRSASAATGDGVASRSVTIERDHYGVPHIFAETSKALFYGYGYAVAEDRLYQMEMVRRSVLGTVSEVLGPAFLKQDEAARQTLNTASIRVQLRRLPRSDLDVFEGYAEGYNARVKRVLDDRDTLMPKQFLDGGFLPDTWTAFDVAMIWIGTLANRYSGGSSEIANLQLLTRLKQAKGPVVGAQLFEQLRWLEDMDAPTTVPRVPAAPGFRQPQPRRTALKLAPISLGLQAPSDFLQASNDGIAAPEERPTASYAWIVSAAKTTDGSTILNNGPQFGWFNPSSVYAVGLHGAGFNIVGNSPFGHPAVLFGTNQKIAWGSTAGPLDVNDIYQVDLNPTNPHEYRFNGRYRAMDKRVEVIKVKGAADATVEIFSTLHGRVTAVDIGQNTAYAMKSSWRGFEIQSLVAWLHSTQATNWDEFLAQAARVAITNNWFYADDEGNIGYVSVGRLPIRPKSQDIRLPAVGDGTMEWRGIHPFRENPQVLNPPQGYLANWNNQSAPGVHTDGGNYSAVSRVNEFIARLGAKSKLTPEEVTSLDRLTSNADMNARYFIPYIEAAARPLSPSDPSYAAAKLLAEWDGINAVDAKNEFFVSPAVTVLRAWLPIMYRRLLADDLPPDVFSNYSSADYPTSPPTRPQSPGNGSKLLFNALRGADAGVPQAYDFFHGADKDQMIRDALQEAVAGLTATSGTDPSKWLTPVVKHKFVTDNFLGIPQAGKDEEIQLPSFLNKGSEDHHVTFRAGAVTLCTVAAPGQSGFISRTGTTASHYSDQLELFQHSRCKLEALNKPEIDAGAESIEMLIVQ